MLVRPTDFAVVTDRSQSRLKKLLSWQLSQASARAHRVLSEYLDRAGATGYEYRVLATLGDLGQVSQADLGRASALDRRDVTHTVRELEERQLVTRKPDPGDARRTLVALSDDGNTMLERLDSVVNDVQDEVFASLDAVQRRTLLELLEQLSRPCS